MKNSPFIPFSCLVLAMALWASSFIALKIAVQTYDPMVVIFGRMAIAAACFLFFAGKFRRVVFRKKDLKLIFLMVLFEPCLYFIFEAKAMENTTASQAGMICSMLPLLVAIAAVPYLKEHLSLNTLAGFSMAIIGACLLSIVGTPTDYAPNPPLGNFLEFMAMVCATGYTIILKRLSDSFSPILLTGIQAVAGTIFYFPLLFLPSTNMPISFHPLPAMSILYLGTFITLGAYGLYNFGVSRIPAGQASAFVNLIPVFTIFMGWIVLGEKLTWLQALASVMVFFGVLFSQADLNKRPQLLFNRQRD